MHPFYTIVFFFFFCFILCFFHCEHAFAEKYNGDLAFKCAILSSVTYTSPTDIQNWKFPNPICSDFSSDFRVHKVFISPSAALAFVGVDNNARQVVVAFKGTNSTDDLITDIKSVMYFTDECVVGDLSLGLIHHGFCNYYRDLVDMGLPEVTAGLLSLYPDYQVVVTGHSLGGAAAALGALDLAWRYGVRPVLYTFGQPRTGDATFSKELTKACSSLWRIVHRSDMVVHLPLCCHSLTMGCREDTTCPYHSTNQVWYNNDMMDKGDYKICGGSGENKTCENTFDLSVNDHLYYFNIRIGQHCKKLPGSDNE
mmetsp:Transcript_28536/g.37339  ORF Transcript_28536/g.37339 Transcript_28536/m.37339 type:complete len:311 (-) Transcript_28536:383-1315(-)